MYKAIVNVIVYVFVAVQLHFLHHYFVLTVMTMKTNHFVHHITFLWLRICSHCALCDWECNCKNDWWGRPLYLKFWIKLTALERNRRFSISSLVATQR